RAPEPAGVVATRDASIVPMAPLSNSATPANASSDAMATRSPVSVDRSPTKVRVTALALASSPTRKRAWSITWLPMFASAPAARATIDQVAGEADRCRNGPVCHCGNRGCLEAMAGGPALGRLAVEAARDGRSDFLANRLLSSGSLGARELGQAAQHGDTVALEI